MKISTPNVFLPENGEHTAVLTSVEDLGVQDSKFGKRETAKFVFTLDDSGAEQWWYMKPTLHPASNFYKVASALLNRVPPKEIDTKDLIGLRCRLITEQYTNQQGQPRSGVKEILPMTNGAPPPRQYNVPPRQQQQAASYRPPQQSDPITDDDIPF